MDSDPLASGRLPRAQPAILLRSEHVPVFVQYAVIGSSFQVTQPLQRPEPYKPAGVSAEC